MDDAHQTFLRYLRLSDELIEQSSKDLVAEAARVLAQTVAGYEARFGEIPVEESLRLLQVQALSDEDARTVARGLETLVGVLGMLREEIVEDQGGSLH